ncbi:MAG TPA: hypothetical protein VG710_07140 [Opitutus sp.]|nr:hypothetical protein [Opitutus sp.]
MTTSCFPKIAVGLACIGLTHLAVASDKMDSVVTAVFSRSFNHYERPVQADGTPVRQSYVIAKGGFAPGEDKDPSIDEVKFPGIVRLLAGYLADQGYVPAKNPKKADLMLVVHWGKTIPFSDGVQRNMMDQGLESFAALQQLGHGVGGAPGAGNPDDGLPPSAAVIATQPGQSSKAAADLAEAAVKEAATEQMVQGVFELREAQNMRTSADTYNANLLGYTGELKRRDNPSIYGGAGTAYNDLLADIESERYYVAVTAYDFQEALRHQNKKGLWRTVASIDARGNRFNERLATMLDRASHYFGRDSERLVREFEYIPHVDLGELKVLGVVDEKPAPKK